MIDAVDNSSVAVKRDPYERVRTVLIVALIILLPFFSGSNHYRGKAVSELLLLALASAALFSFWLRRGGKLSVSAFEVLGVVVLLATALSAMQARYGIDAWHAVGALFLLGLMYRVARSAASDPSYKRILVAALLVSGLLQSLFALHQRLFTAWYQETFPGYFYEYLAPHLRGDVVRVVGGFINPNYLAAYLNLCFAVALAMLLFGSLSVKVRAGAGVLALLFASVLVLTASKAGIILMVVTVAILLTLKDRRLLLVIGAIVLIVVVVLIVLAVPNPFVRALTDPYTIMRVHIWGASARMAADFPLLGVGLDNYRQVSHLYAPPTDQFLVRYSHVPRIAHNSYLHALAEMGLAGFLPLLAIVAAVAAGIWILLVRRKTDLSKNAILLGFGAGILTVLLHCFVDNVAHSRCLLATSMLLFAAVAAHLARDGKLRLNPFKRNVSIPLGLPLRATPLGAAAVLIFGFAVAQIYKPFDYEARLRPLSSKLASVSSDLPALRASGGPADRLAREAKDLLGDLEKVTAELGELAAEFPSNEAVRRRLADAHLEMFRYTGEVHSFSEALANFAASDANLPGQTAGITEQITTYVELGIKGYPRTEEILDLLEDLARRAIRNRPNNAFSYRLAAGIAREKGDLERSKELLEKAIAIEPNFLQAISNLGSIARALGDDELERRARRLYAEADDRISKGPAPAAGDEYARRILAKPVIAAR